MLKKKKNRSFFQKQDQILLNFEQRKRKFWEVLLRFPYVDSNYEFMQIEIRLASIHDLDRSSLA